MTSEAVQFSGTLPTICVTPGCRQLELGPQRKGRNKGLTRNVTGAHVRAIRRGREHNSGPRHQSRIVFRRWMWRGKGGGEETSPRLALPDISAHNATNSFFAQRNHKFPATFLSAGAYKVSQDAARGAS